MKNLIKFLAIANFDYRKFRIEKESNRLKRNAENIINLGVEDRSLLKILEAIKYEQNKLQIKEYCGLSYESTFSMRKLRVYVDLNTWMARKGYNRRVRDFITSNITINNRKVIANISIKSRFEYWLEVLGLAFLYGFLIFNISLIFQNYSRWIVWLLGTILLTIFTTDRYHTFMDIMKAEKRLKKRFVKKS